MDNREILISLLRVLIPPDCGTGKIMEMERIGKDKYYAKKFEFFQGLINYLPLLDKKTLPNDKVAELERILQELQKEAMRAEQEYTKSKKFEWGNIFKLRRQAEVICQELLKVC